MNGSVMQMRDNGEFESLQPAIGTDAHRVQTARWVLETFEASTPVYKQAQKVIAAYLAGHRVQTARWVLETFEASTPVYKQAQKVIAAYLAGKPLPGA